MGHSREFWKNLTKININNKVLYIIIIILENFHHDVFPQKVILENYLLGGSNQEDIEQYIFIFFCSNFGKI